VLLVCMNPQQLYVCTSLVLTFCQAFCKGEIDTCVLKQPLLVDVSHFEEKNLLLTSM